MMPGNMQGMMKKVQKMQKQMQKDQEELNQTEFAGQATNEEVVVKMTGDKKMTDIAIKEEAIDPDDPEMLQDLIIMAVNDAMDKIDQKTQAVLGKYSKGMPRM
ncbi:nucleoid-associated protein [Ligilactobacillus pabuli]|uniref:Nucleoid-associated protein LPAF129_04410 n=1 Tax=Ligilactobacillus pabuli TaxID=2886039 RepID=A0ABQ5JJ66_9LACO|nr:YbaB/EbfC family nucleoid-associated protein [Ligilactobacillus pabuli]GKS80756.1 nucleoid-associated protein [Ligilactobacillus pabuli]HIW89485.1 YbaB/EbfC family nucleoid-associated protein [Candidatus Ligilactobacillus excrementipullorum]